MIPLKEQVYLHLKNLIINNEFSYQEIYSETKLSKKLGLSRTPFRDAIHRLAQEGYIDIIPSKGFMLHQLSKKDIQETIQVRSALEAFCAFQGAKNAETPEAQKLFNELEIIMEQLRRILETTGSIEEFCDFDFQFHIKLIEYIKNEKFTSLFETYLYRMRKFAEQSLSLEGRMEDTYIEHLSILNNMKEGNIANIFQVTLAHIEITREINLEFLKN